MIKRQITMAPSLGEVSPRRAHGLLVDPNLRASLREAYNVWVTQNLEAGPRPPTKDMGALPDSGETVCKTVAFHFSTGGFTNITFSALEINQAIVGSETAFATITTTWTATDIAAMDFAQAEDKMCFVTPGKEPMVFTWTGAAYTWASLQSQVTGAATTNPPWHAAATTSGLWPHSVAFMVARWVFIDHRKEYGSRIGDVLNYDLSTTTVDGDTVVTRASAFGFDAMDDMDSGFMWIQGGSLAFAGSPAAVWMMSNLTDGLSAISPNIKQYGASGAWPVKAVDTDGGMIYFTADGRTAKIFAVTPEGPIHHEINEYSKHFWDTYRPVRMVYQRSPDTIVWILREDGQVITLSIGQKRFSWAELNFDGVVNDIWVGLEDGIEYVYLDITRGDDRRIERFEDTDPLSEDYLLDGMISSDQGAGVVPTAESDNAGAAAWTVTGHAYAGGELVRTDGIDNAYGYVVVVDANTISIQQPSMALLPYGQGFAVTFYPAILSVTVAHLKNKPVSMFLDGRYSSFTASSAGVITFPTAATVAAIGTSYYAIMQPQSFIDIHGLYPAAVDKITARFHLTSAFLYGKFDTPYDELTSYHIDSDPQSVSVEDLPISGYIDWECSYRIGGTLTPFLLVSCIAQINVQGE